MKNKLNTSLSLRKLLLSALVAAPLATLPSSLWALPANADDLLANLPGGSKSGNVITVGTNNITWVSGTQINVSSTTTNAVVKWADFGGAAAANMQIVDNDLVMFNLPSSSSSILNVVTSTGAGHGTTIAGDLISNGNLYILNPNGIIIGATANITANSVGLSTIPESEFPFLANGTLSYVGTATNGVTVNSGANITAATGSGNVYVAGKSVALAGLIDAGTLTVTAQNGNAALAAGGNLTVGDSSAKKGNLTVNVQGGAANAITIGDGSNGALRLYGSSASLTTDNGGITQSGTGQFSIGTGDATITVNSGTGAVDLGKVSAATGGKKLTATVTAGTVTNFTADQNNLVIGLTTSGGATVATGAGDLNIKASTINGNLSVTAAGGDLNSDGDVTFTGGGNVALLSASTAGKKITFSSVGNLAPTTVTSNGTGEVALTSKSGSVTLPAISSGKLTVTASTDISSAAVQTITGDATFDAGGSITLGTATVPVANALTNVILKNAPSGATVTDGSADGFVLAKGTSATGNVTLITTNAAATAGVVIGAASGDTVKVTGDLSIDTSAGNVDITDATDNITVTGALTLKAGTGNVALNGKTDNGVNLNHQFGQINVTSAKNVTVYEKTTLNLGAITASGNLRAYSASGIVNSGKLILANAAANHEFGAGSGAAPGDIVLDNAANAIAGNIYILDDVNILTKASMNDVAPPTTFGNYLAKNVTIVNVGNLNLPLLTNSYGAGLTGDLNLTATGAANAITLGASVVGGKVILSAPGAVTAAAVTGTTSLNTISNFTVTAGAAVDVRSSTAATFNATLSGTAAANFQSGDQVTIGSFGSSTTGLVTFKSGNKKNIVDSVAGIGIFGGVKFDTNGGVSVTKANHSFGPIDIVATSNDATVTLIEGGTLKINSLDLGGKKTTVALTSTGGDIVQAGAITNGDSSKTATFTATKGKVTLNDANNTLKNSWGVTAAGDVAINLKTNDLVLGNITTGGALTVSNATAGKKISQASGTTINAYDTVTLTTNAADLTVANSGNRFGGLILSSGSGNISLKESTTVNLKSAVTTGNLTVESENGSIIDSTDSNVAANRVDMADTKTASFTASKGSVTLDLAGSKYGIVKLNTAGDASILDSAGNTTFDTSVIGGSLDVLNTLAGATITQAGAITVSGNTTLTTSNGAVDLQNSANQFGGLRFTVGDVAGFGGARISESGTLNLRGGSVATGDVVLNTGADFITSGVGGSSFTKALTISATGTIKPAAGSLLVVGTFTVFSNNTKDLSALSKSGNLTGKDPVNLGTGTYVPPSQ